MGIIFRQSLKGTIVHYIGTFIGFISNLFVQTYFLTKTEIGLLGIIYQIGLFVSVLALLGSTTSAMRFFPYFKNEKNKDNGFFFYMLLLPALGAIIFIPSFVLLKDIICSIFAEKSPIFIDYYNWVIPLILFLMYWVVFETYSNIKMRIAVPKLIREVVVRLILLSLYILYGFGVLSLTQLVTGCISTYGVVMIITFIYIRHFNSITLKHDSKFINKDLRTKIIKYSAFVLVSSLGSNIIMQLDAFMLSSMKGLEFFGIYLIAQNMAAVVEMPSRSIGAISAPIAAEALKNNDFETANNLYKKVSLHQLIIGSVVFMLIWINIDNIFAIIPNGESFSQGKWVVLFMGLAKLVTVTLNFGATLISFSKYYYWGLYFMIFIAGVGFGTNLLLIPKLGITGAAIASFITCMLTYSAQQYIVLKKVKGNPYTKSTVKQIALILFAIGLNYLLPNWSHNPFVDIIFRTIIIGSITVFLIYKLNISPQICHVFDETWGKLKKHIK